MWLITLLVVNAFFHNSLIDKEKIKKMRVVSVI